jgi:hypothetical protein
VSSSLAFVRASTALALPMPIRLGPFRGQLGIRTVASIVYFWRKAKTTLIFGPMSRDLYTPELRSIRWPSISGETEKAQAPRQQFP